MEQNAKNRLLELLQNLGISQDVAQFDSTPDAAHGFGCELSVQLPDGRRIEGQGNGPKRKAAELAAAEELFQTIDLHHSDLWVDWELIMVKAQAGDALIKLGAYLSTELKSSADKSLHLQQFESDQHLARVFDVWQQQGAPECLLWGPNLGEKKKASLVEAIVWDRYHQQLLHPQSAPVFHDLLESLEI